MQIVVKPLPLGKMTDSRFWQALPIPAALVKVPPCRTDHYVDGGSPNRRPPAGDRAMTLNVIVIGASIVAGLVLLAGLARLHDAAEKMMAKYEELLREYREARLHGPDEDSEETEEVT